MDVVERKTEEIAITSRGTIVGVCLYRARSSEVSAHLRDTAIYVGSL